MQNSCHLLQCIIYGVGYRLRTSQNGVFLDFVFNYNCTKMFPRDQILGERSAILNITQFWKRAILCAKTVKSMLVFWEKNIIFPAILRFGFIVWSPLQVVTNKKWQFVSIYRACFCKRIATYSNILYTVLEIGSGRAKTGSFWILFSMIIVQKCPLGTKYWEKGRPSWISHNFENGPFYARKL